MATPDPRLTPAAFRRRFPIFRERVYLNSCSQGALSTDVDAAVQTWLDSWRTKGSPWDEWVGWTDALRGAFASSIGAGSDEVAVLPSASVAASVVASALSWDAPRDTVVTTEFEFPTMGHVWLAQQARGARVRWVRARHGDLPLTAFEAAVDGRTRLVAATHVSYRSGFRLDVARLAASCRQRGALLLVDDYQSTGTRPTDVRALGIDMLITGALKYLLGPPGVAFLYVRRGLIGGLEPAVTGWLGRARPFAFKTEVLDWAPDARRFENGTPQVPAVCAALAGLRLLEDLGYDLVAEQIATLTTRFCRAAAAEGWTLLTPHSAPYRGALCVVRSHDAAELERRLAGRGIITSARADGLRLSFHAYNDETDVDAAVAALRAEAELIDRA